MASPLQQTAPCEGERRATGHAGRARSPAPATKAAFARAIAERLGLNLEAVRRDIGLRRPELAPLEPDAFLSWAAKEPRTLDDLEFDVGVEPGTLRRDFVRLAARVRRNQRLGRGAWEGIR